MHNLRKKVKNETAVISPVSSKKNISTARNPRNPAYDRYHYHKVTRGESLWTISQRFPGVTTNLLKKINNLHSSSLKVGQILKVPGKFDFVEKFPQFVSKNTLLNRIVCLIFVTCLNVYK
ncbi:MAG: LysM peptidoglycan-binding domain-containing protein [Coprobacter fastidiosus]